MALWREELQCLGHLEDTYLEGFQNATLATLVNGVPVLEGVEVGASPQQTVSKLFLGQICVCIVERTSDCFNKLTRLSSLLKFVAR